MSLGSRGEGKLVRATSKEAVLYLVAEFISPKKCTLFVLEWVILSQKV